VNGLKYHYSNPKFDGLPWPADRAVTSHRECVRKSYSRSDALAEVERLRAKHHRVRWSVKFCRECQAHHVQRGA